MSAWIRMIPDEEADETLRGHLDGVRTPHGTVDNVMRVHSLRPHTMAGHVALYRSVLHHADNSLPLWFLEVVGCYTSWLNRCDYSYAHHSANVRRLLADGERATTILQALEADRPEDAFEARELALLRYTARLTRDVAALTRDDVASLQAAGCEDGEILEVNQVCAYFNYANRLLNGLGVTTEGDTIGYYAED